MEANSNEYGAPGPVEVDKHTSANPVGREGAVDPRAAFLESERQAQTVLSGAIADPTGSILLTELQEVSRKLDMFGMAALTAIWLTGMTIGYAGYVYFKNNPSPVPVEAETESE